MPASPSAKPSAPPHEPGSRPRVVVTRKLDGTNVSPRPLPGRGSASGFNGKRTDELSFFSFQTFTTPPSIYLLNPKTGDVSLHHQPKLAYTPDDSVTRQVAFQSEIGRAHV